MQVAESKYQFASFSLFSRRALFDARVFSVESYDHACDHYISELLKSRISL